MATTPSKGPRVRSPNYPSIGLEDALDKARTLYERERTTPTNIDIAASHWGYKSATTGGGLVAAALRAYGLVEYEGTNAQRMVRVTDAGRKLLLDNRPDSPDRGQALQRAALLPAIHAELWEKWGNELPSDQNIRYYLTVDRGFNEKTVGEFISEYKSTLTFAGLLEDGRIPVGPTTEEAISLTDQAIVQVQPRQPVPIAATIMPEVAIPAGEREAVRGSLADGRHFRLLVSGGGDTDRLRKDLKKIRKFLRAQEMLLSDENENEDDAAQDDD